MNLSLIFQAWLKYPALFYGLSMLLGYFCYFFSSAYSFIPLLALWLPFLYEATTQKKGLHLSCYLSIFLCLSCYIHARSSFACLDLPEKGLEGQAFLSISSIEKRSSIFGSRWVYSCFLHQFNCSNGKNNINGRLRCFVQIPSSQQFARPSANYAYLVKLGLVEKRFKIKKQLQAKMKSYFSNPVAASFLAGMATGEFDDGWLKQQFSRFGLQHLMAISGFHFAILVFILTVFLRVCLPFRLSIFFTLSLISSYALLLGPVPSVMRAWLMCTFTLVGSLLGKEGSSLNFLGVALIILLLFDPLFIQTLGFQFSFLTTVAIVTLYRPMDRFLEEIFTTYQLKEIVQTNLFNQYGYCFLAFFRKSMALGIAVNLFAIPLTLYYFQKFPYLSMLYNLFFPCLVAFALFFLMMAFLFSSLPLAGNFLVWWSNYYTDVILKMTYQLPLSLDAHFSVRPFSAIYLVVYFTFLLVIALSLQEQKKEQAALLFV